MNHTIENNLLRITVREHGAELISLFDKRDNCEHIWQANPLGWAWYAPHLFPIVGRSINDKIIVDSVEYAIEKHGFLRHSIFEIINKSENKITFKLQSNPKTLVKYPYIFNLKISYELIENEVKTEYVIENLDDKDIFFQIGGHPAFNVPFYENEKYSDYFIEFEKDTNLICSKLNNEGYFNNQLETVNLIDKKLQMHHNLFLDDALIFKKLQSRKVKLGSGLHSKSIEILFQSFNMLGIWTSTKNANFVCIEPWIGCADSINHSGMIEQKEGIYQLAVKQKAQFLFSIVVNN